jgi:hypothetical protein
MIIRAMFFADDRRVEEISVRVTTALRITSPLAR